MIYPEIEARAYAPGIGEAVADRTINRTILRECPPYREYLEISGNIYDAEADIRAAVVARVNDSKWAWDKTYELLHEVHTSQPGEEDFGVIRHVAVPVHGHYGLEKWGDVADRVSHGNSLLEPRYEYRAQERAAMNYHLRQASILMSGRHLQHGDENQPSRPMEVFTNCSTSASTFLMFYLLLSGSGVGRCYDDEMILVDFNKLPTVVCVVDAVHADVQSGLITALSLESAMHLYAAKKVHVFEVEDSREGWAKALEKLELMAFQGVHRDSVLLLDFSKVRPNGAPIMGMQGRPASGPGPIMAAIANVAKLRDAGMAPWRAAMYADHYIAECVLVGGARRAARMATKTWYDRSVLEFIRVKRGGFLWSSNNSVTVDDVFWTAVKRIWPLVEHLIGCEEHVRESIDALLVEGAITDLEHHAFCVFDAVCRACYFDKTGEPGFITVSKLTYNEEGTDVFFDGNFAESSRYKLSEDTLELTKALANVWSRCRYKVICNPCGEIVLIMLGAYCVIADVVPFFAGKLARDEYTEWCLENPTGTANRARLGHARHHNMLMEWDDDAEDAFRVATRALIRTNLMDSLYSKEVKRTNRIGVGMTGLHEYAYARFGYTWADLVVEERSKPFWMMLARFKEAVQQEAEMYATELGVVIPHTDTTMKPAGTTSKLFSLTEGAHLPSMREYLRWVQFRNGSSQIEQYEKLGYPTRKLQIYAGTTIVGFPTRPAICELGMGDLLVTAAEATPQEQYSWLRLLEKYYIRGVDQQEVPLRETGNQVSYTLKYNPEIVGFEAFMQTLLEGQSTIRCCSVMPQIDGTEYEYQPEEPTSRSHYESICLAIESASNSNPNTERTKEDVGLEHVDCAGGACPVDFNATAA